MKEWFDRINQVPEFFVKGVVGQAATVGLPNGAADACSGHLLARRAELLNLMKSNPAVFPGVPAADWNQL